MCTKRIIFNFFNNILSIVVVVSNQNNENAAQALTVLEHLGL